MADVSIRLARPLDRRKIREMFRDAEASFVRMPVRDVDQILHSRLILVATKQDVPKGVVISIWPYVPIAWLDALAFVPECGQKEMSDLLLMSFEEHLVLVGSQQVFCSMEEHSHEAIRQLLLARGFEVTGGFWRYRKADFDVPVFDSSTAAIISAKKEDLASICRIEGLCFEPPWRDTEHKLRRTMRQFSYFRVAFVDRAIVGFQYSTVDDNRVGQFVHLAVDPAFRGKNIGKLLLADAIRFFRCRQVIGIETRTENTNHAAQQLFASFGFQAEGPHREVLSKTIGTGEKSRD